jgi:hypothetical protein
MRPHLALAASAGAPTIVTFDRQLARAGSRVGMAAVPEIEKP